MTDVDRYITDDAIELAVEQTVQGGHIPYQVAAFIAKGVAARILPGILAQHRADVLWQVASYADDLDPQSADVLGHVVAVMADEAVPDGR